MHHIEHVWDFLRPVFSSRQNEPKTDLKKSQIVPFGAKLTELEGEPDIRDTGSKERRVLREFASNGRSMYPA